MRTQQLYLDDSYLKEMDAEILEVQPERNGWKIILDKTVFYPMGGTQVHSTSEVGKILIPEIENLGETIIIHYSLV